MVVTMNAAFAKTILNRFLDFLIELEEVPADGWDNQIEGSRERVIAAMAATVDAMKRGRA